jgi:hypothetical protein
MVAPVYGTSNSDKVSSRDRGTSGPAQDNSGGPRPVSSLPWGSITDRPPVLVDLGELADGAGYLFNDGSGVLSWASAGGGSVAWGDITGTPTTLAGYGITDAVLQADFDTLSSAFTDLSSDFTALSGEFDTLGASLAAVAFTGAYGDLTGLPDLSGYVDGSSLAAVAFSGEYGDLLSLPALAAVAISGLASDVLFSSFAGLVSTEVASALDELAGMISGGGGVVADGTYGDITVSGSGTVWTVDSPAGANPSATIGLAAVNGSASTFMRSDAAPAFPQALILSRVFCHC